MTVDMAVGAFRDPIVFTPTAFGAEATRVNGGD
jgi:hypothetical protein